MKLHTILSKSNIHWGLLILRIGIGAMFIIHGYPKIVGGTQTWAFLGMQMSNIGIDFGHVFWGFMAAFAEFAGGILLIAGLFTKPAALMMLFTMFIAAVMHFQLGEGIKGASHAIELGIVFLAILIAGAGKYSLDYLLFNNRMKK